MSTILYHLVKGNTVSERCNPLDVPELLKSGYSVSKDLNKSSAKADLSDDEIKELAKTADIKIGRKSIKTLKKELEL